MKFTEFKVHKIISESSTIKSFYLLRKDNRTLEGFKPGQFVTVRIIEPSSGKEFTRNYTLSDRPYQGYYRITVKRESNGVVSNHLHSKIKEDDFIEMSDPSGNFYLDQTSQHPIVLLSAGVGITPMLSMIEYLVHESSKRKVSFLHVSTDKKVQPMAARLQELAKSDNIRINIHHSNPLSDEIKNIDYNNTGRITKESMIFYLDNIPNSIYYLCGPYGFMNVMFNSLISLGVSASNIHFEFFGSVKNLGGAVTNDSSNPTKYQIKFKKSEKSIEWIGKHNSVLELAESMDIYPDNSCRMGTCSTCETKVLNGSIEYNPEPFMEARENHAFICCSIPTSDLTLDL